MKVTRNRIIKAAMDAAYYHDLYMALWHSINNHVDDQDLYKLLVESDSQNQYRIDKNQIDVKANLEKLYDKDE